MRTDIRDGADVLRLIETFYTRVKKDPVIGFFFTEVVPIDWEHHIPKITAFWESIIFAKAGYKGEPMTAHIQLHQKQKMEKAHFDRWVKIFTETIDELFEGPKAEETKQRAASIAAIMFFKVTGGK